MGKAWIRIICPAALASAETFVVTISMVNCQPEHQYLTYRGREDPRGSQNSQKKEVA